MSLLSCKKDQFFLDGQPFTIISGAVHYFRIVPEYWEDTLKKMKACGFNTVETYTCWNLHERKENQFDFSGILNIERFIDIADSLGLNVILRPGPYICAEWEFGGLPSWLLAYPLMRFRCYDELFLSKVRRYFKELFRRLNSRLSVNGGNIFMVQIENEYGSYGHDKTYLKAIMDIYKECGVDCLLFTADGGEHSMLTGGTMEGCLAAVNFGGLVKKNFDALKKRGRTHPIMCVEFWNGQFDHWYEDHNVVASDSITSMLNEIFDYGASVNVYMFQGGTNFGFMNGANYFNGYCADVTSYDYDAPVSEAGDLTPKYFEIKKVIEEHFGKAPQIGIAETRKVAYGKVRLTQTAPLFENLNHLSEPVFGPTPLSMEELGQDFGFILYSSIFEGPLEKGCLHIFELHDRALIFINGEFKGIKERDRRDDEITVELGFGEKARVDILVENMGRINYGPRMSYEKKGIVGHVEMDYTFTQQIRFGWTMYPLPLEDLSGLCYQSVDEVSCPSFLRGHFTVEEKGDSFLKLTGFTKGAVYINGFNLGRYWNTAGPQKTLYVPAPVLREGQNELVVFELEGYREPSVEFLDKPELGIPVDAKQWLT